MGLSSGGLGIRAEARCRELSRPPYSEAAANLTRRYLTPAHRATMGALHDWMSAAGMSVRTDPAASLIGRFEGRETGQPALVIGSHIDSVRDAGAYDGMLGVLLGLACVEAIAASDWRPRFAIEVIGFGDEEGSRFQASMNGSRSFAGRLDVAAALDARDADGMTLTEALSDFRLDPTRLAEARRAPGDVLAFIEPHIEQGPLLEARGAALGVVSSIAGQWRLKVRMTGSAGHAGTTPMGMRKDALAAAAEAVLMIERLATEAKSDLVATVGQIMAKPGAPNVVPGLAEFTIDVRAGTDPVRDAGLARIEAVLADIARARGVGLAIDRVQNLPATAMDARLQALLARALAANGHAPQALVSGAGHDAMMIAGLAPTAMLFIRCTGGVSHNPAESVIPEDCEAALAALLSFIERLDQEILMSDLPADFFGEIDPPDRRLLMGPGPSNVHPRVRRAMSAAVLGQFDPEFAAVMNQTMALYRAVFQTQNRWTLMIDGSARAAIEAALVSVLEPGDTVLVVSAGRFGLLLQEIGRRCGAKVEMVEAEWGDVVPADAIAAAAKRVRPRLIAAVHGDTSTTMAQPLEGIGQIARDTGALSYIDATATLGGMSVPVDAWGADIVSAGLQKCLGGPPGIAPITISDRAAERMMSRRHVEKGIAKPGDVSSNGAIIGSNYFDLAMLMDYWSEKRLNHHTEAASMLYAARECARIALGEGLGPRFERHRLAGLAMCAGAEAMGLKLYGGAQHRMTNVTGIYVPQGVDAEAVRRRMREEFEIEIGAAFGPLAGKIWRIGAMAGNARRHHVIHTLMSLAMALRREGFSASPDRGAEAALKVYDEGGS